MKYRDKADGAVLTLRRLQAKYRHISFSAHTAEELADPIRSPDLTQPPSPHHAWEVTQPTAEDTPPLQATAAQVSIDSPEYREGQRTAKLSQLAETRYDKEVDGTEVGGIPVKTDRESVALITSTKSGLEAMGGTVDWKSGDGHWVSIDLQTINAMEAAVFTHIQRVRAVEREKAAQVLEAQTLAELDAVDLYGGWDA